MSKAAEEMATELLNSVNGYAMEFGSPDVIAVESRTDGPEAVVVTFRELGTRHRFGMLLMELEPAPGESAG